MTPRFCFSFRRWKTPAYVLLPKWEIEGDPSLANAAGGVWHTCSSAPWSGLLLTMSLALRCVFCDCIKPSLLPRNRLLLVVYRKVLCLEAMEISGLVSFVWLILKFWSIFIIKSGCISYFSLETILGLPSSLFRKFLEVGDYSVVIDSKTEARCLFFGDRAVLYSLCLISTYSIHLSTDYAYSIK